jgi:hypothetical protein
VVPFVDAMLRSPGGFGGGSISGRTAGGSSFACDKAPLGAIRAGLCLLATVARRHPVGRRATKVAQENTPFFPSHCPWAVRLEQNLIRLHNQRG